MLSTNVYIYENTKNISQNGTNPFFLYIYATLTDRDYDRYTFYTKDTNLHGIGGHYFFFWLNEKHTHWLKRRLMNPIKFYKTTFLLIHLLYPFLFLNEFCVRIKKKTYIIHNNVCIQDFKFNVPSEAFHGMCRLIFIYL